MSPCPGGVAGDRICLLCSKESLPSQLGLGQVAQVAKGVVAHDLCIKFAKGIKNKNIVVGKTRLQEEVTRARHVVCVFCKKPGAASGCWKPFCRVSFHLGCSLGEQVIHRHDIFMSSCWQHSRRQSLLSDRCEPGHCGVCGWVVEDDVSFYTLVSPCCNKAHHRDCLQVLGSLGVTSCPSCKNSKSFQPEMIVNGIFFNQAFILPPSIDRSNRGLDISENSNSSKSLKVADFSLRDSGISLSPPLIASTPIILESDKSSKRKSLSEPEESLLCNSSKRQKSATETDSTLSELRPRILMQDLSADPFVEMHDIEENTDMRSLVSELSVEDIIEVDDEDNKEDGREDNMGCIEMVDDSYYSNAGEESCEDNEDIDRTVSIYSATIDEETDLDEDDVAEFIEATKEESQGSITSEIKETTSSASEGDNSHRENEGQPDPAKYLCLSQEKLLAVKRKQVLKKIRKLPISERFILHGRNLLPWRQKFENYSECNSEWMDNYDNEKIDEIIDLNLGEKSFFKLWNDHVRMYSGLGMTHMALVVMRFIEASGVKILEQNIYRNFAAHLSSLVGMGLIGAHTQIRALMQIQHLMRDIHVGKLNQNWKNSFKRSSPSCLEDTPKSRKSRQCLLRQGLHSAKNSLVQVQVQVNEEENLLSLVKEKQTDSSPESMPVLCEEACQSSCPDLQCSPEMPILVPQHQLINKNTNPFNQETEKELQGEEKTARRGRGRPRKHLKLKKKLLEQSPALNGKALRKNQARKAKERSELEFAIKRGKKQKLKVANKLAPVKSKLRKNLKFFNEQ